MASQHVEQPSTATPTPTRGEGLALAPEGACQYQALPIRAVPPLGLLRPARLAREQLRRRHSGVPDPGQPSVHRPGDWVQVKDAAQIRATLDAHNRHRGLWFTDGQWAFCGQVLQVEHVVRRMLDDHYRTRRLSHTVSLAGATCRGPGGEQGCGLACALLFRDVWLEAAAPPSPQPTREGRRVTVLPLDEIRATLDARGTLDGVPFHPAMGRYAGTNQVILSEVDHRALPWWQYPVGRWFLLDAARCQGEPLGAAGCDRQCALLWHSSWLEGID